MKRVGVIAGIMMTFALLLCGHGQQAFAYSSYYTNNCQGCHGSVSTCAGCHAHGTHPNSSKSGLNLAAATDKTTYQPGETVSVTFNGGYRSGWVRAILYDQDMKELARSAGSVASGADAPSGASSLPVTLQAPAPTTPGTYKYSAAWYGNKYDLAEAGGGTTFFGPRWLPDPGNADHGQEIVATNSFTVADVAPPAAAAISVTDSVAPTSDLQVPFGTVTAGVSASQTVTVSNKGNANLLLGAVAVLDPLAAPFAITADACSNQVIAPAASCSLTVAFTPTSAGSVSDSFSIPSNDPAKSSVTVSVSGTGASLPTPTISVTDSVAPTSDLQVPFGTVTAGGSASQTVTVSNKGNADLLVGAVASLDPLVAPFAITADSCSNQVIAPAASCSLTIAFTPTSLSVFADSFDIPSSDPSKASVTISLSGTGASAAIGDISVTDAVSPADDLQIPYGDVRAGRAVDKAVTVANAGSGELSIGSIGSADPLSGPFSIVSDSCSGTTLVSGTACSLTVRFVPTADCGSSTGTEAASDTATGKPTTCPYSDSFDIPSSDPDESVVTLQVSGAGIASPGNNPPSKPRPRYPADKQKDLKTSLLMQWEASEDPDGDPVSYELQISTTADFRDPLIVQTAADDGASGPLFAGTGIGFLCFGLVFAGSARGRKGLLLIAGVVILIGGTLVGCSGGGGGSPATPGSGTMVSQQVSGLQTTTTYYWKVIASDNNGGMTESDSSTFSTK